MPNLAKVQKVYVAKRPEQEEQVPEDRRIKQGQRLRRHKVLDDVKSVRCQQKVYIPKHGGPESESSLKTQATSLEDVSCTRYLDDGRYPSSSPHLKNAISHESDEELPLWDAISAEEIKRQTEELSKRKDSSSWFSLPTSMLDLNAAASTEISTKETSERQGKSIKTDAMPTIAGDSLDYVVMFGQLAITHGPMMRPFRLLSSRLNQDRWYYIDQEGLVRGPFRVEDMDAWFFEDYLPDNLMVALATPESFHPLRFFLDTAAQMARTTLSPPRMEKRPFNIEVDVAFPLWENTLPTGLLSDGF